jgi:hypothetical protein
MLPFLCNLLWPPYLNIIFKPSHIPSCVVLLFCCCSIALISFQNISNRCTQYSLPLPQRNSKVTRVWLHFWASDHQRTLGITGTLYDSETWNNSIVKQTNKQTQNLPLQPYGWRMRSLPSARVRVNGRVQENSTNVVNGNPCYWKVSQS